MPSVVAGLQSTPGGAWAMQEEIVLLASGSKHGLLKEGAKLIRRDSKRGAGLFLGTNAIFCHDDPGNEANRA